MHNKAIGTAVLALGALVAVLGLALMAILGPDGRFTSGPHPVDADGVAVVTAPTVISWKNVEVEILAEVPANKPVFVGVANSVDLQAYVKGVRRLEVTSFETPWKVRTRQAAGRDALARRAHRRRLVAGPRSRTGWRRHQDTAARRDGVGCDPLGRLIEPARLEGHHRLRTAGRLPQGPRPSAGRRRAWPGPAFWPGAASTFGRTTVSPTSMNRGPATRAQP